MEEEIVFDEPVPDFRDVIIEIADKAQEVSLAKAERGAAEDAAAAEEGQKEQGEEAPKPHASREETEEEIDTEPKVVTAEEHEENIAAMEKVLDHVLDMAAEGKLPTKEEKPEFVMKMKFDSTEELLTVKMEEAEEVVEEGAYLSPGESVEGVEVEEVEEEEEAESASVQEAWARRQRMLEEFDAVHDEAQRLRIMNMLLHSRVLRLMQRRPKKKSGFSTVSTMSRASPSPSPSPSTDFPDISGMAESLEKELLEAGEVRRQLEAETHRCTAEEELRQRLTTARRGVAERAELLELLQERAMAKLHAPPVRRQEAEQMLKRVWPQLLRLRKERLLHTRAKHDLDDAQEEVAKLEVFGPQRTVAAYEQLAADGVKLAERVQERADQLAALRHNADRDLQQAAHLREALQGAHQDVVEARRNDARTTLFLQRARQDVLKMKKKRDSCYKENRKITKQMELLAYPDLLRDHEDMLLWRLRIAQGELAQLRAAYVNQESRIATARKLLQQREACLKTGYRPPSPPDPSFLLLPVDAKCGPSDLDVKQNG